MDKKNYTVKQVAEALGFSTNTVYKYLDEGKIQATRLGAEGRFRISQKELLRLLGSKNPLPEQITEMPLSAQSPGSGIKPNEEVSEVSFQEDVNLLDKVSNPSIFDWFIACLALFVGLSQFLFPFYTQDISFEPYFIFHQATKFSLIILALVLVAADIFVRRNSILKKSVNILLAALFISLAIPAFYTGNYLNALGNGVVGGFILVFIIFKLNDFVKFSIIILTLAFLSGVMFFINPELFPDLGISRVISNNLLIFVVTWFIALLTIFIGTFLGYFKHRKTLIASFIVLGLGSFAYAVLAVSQGFWEQGAYAIIMGSFAFIFPFWKHFESFAKYSKKELLEGFIWFFLILLIGIGLIIYIQNSFIDIALQENNRGLENAKSVVNDFLLQGQDDVSRFGANKRLLVFMKDPSAAKADLGSLASEFYFNSTVLGRILIIDSKGNGISVYPEDSAFDDLNFSDRDYFILAQNTKKLVVSVALEPRFGNEPRVVAISSPLMDENGKFLGLVVGSIDFVKLSSKLNEIKFGINGQFVIADNQKRIIIHPDSSFLLKPVHPGGALDMAVDGKSGSTNSYDEDGALAIKAFAPISSFNWGIKAQQPLGDLIKSRSRISFLILIVTIISGIGSLISALYLKRR